VKGLAEGLLEHLGVEGYTFIRSEEVYLHPGKSCDVVLNGEKIGSFGQLHPSVSAAYDLQEESFVMEMELAPLVQFATRIPKYSHMPKFPGMQRDISVVVPAAVTDAELEAVIRKHGGELLQDVVVFDLFTSDKIGADKKSLAFKLYYQAEDRTLTDGEVDESMKQILAKVAEEYEGKLRD